MTVTELMINSEPTTKLPDGWRWVRLEDLFEVKQGAAMSPTRRQGTAPQSFLRTLNVLWGSVDLSNLDKMDFAEDEVASLNLRSGDLLVCEGGDVGRTAIWRAELDNCLYQNHIHRLRRKNSNVVPEFYAYWMQAAFKVFQSYKGKEITTTIPNLSGGKLKSFMVPLPPSLAEQERVADILNEKMAAVEKARVAAEACMEAANALPRAYLRAVFESEEAKGWPLKRLGDIAFKGPDNGIFKHRSDFGEGVPIINVSDLYESLTVTLSLTERVKVTNEELKRYGVAEGDLFFCRSSLKREGVGWCCYLKNLPEPAVFDCHVMRAHLDSSEVMPEYAAYYWQLPKVREMVIGNSRTSTMTTMNQDDLATIPIPAAPLDEQSCIVAYLNECFDIAARLRKALTVQSETLKTLPATLLRRAFTGGL